MLVCNPRIMTFKFTVPDLPPSEGIQKIAGFSRGHHHINSVRIGINRSEDSSTCRLFLYTYLNGKQISKYICEVQVGEVCHVTLKMSRYEYYCIASSRETNGDVTDAALSIDMALTLPNIVKRGDNVAKAEVRYETSNSEDSTEIVRLKKGARSSRSMNIEPIIHNVPVFLPDYDRLS